jgi:hypothetical protein
MIPRPLITQPEPDALPVTPSPAKVRAEPAEAPAVVPASTVEGALSGLPQRRRGQTLAAAPKAVTPPAAKPAPARADAGARFSAFHAAGRANRPSAPSEDSR